MRKIFLLATPVGVSALSAYAMSGGSQAKAAARAADKERKTKRLGPLHGLPILIEDNIDTASAPTSAGTPALRDRRPSSDAPVAAKLFSAGAILRGETNMHELAYGITSLPPGYRQSHGKGSCCAKRALANLRWEWYL